MKAVIICGSRALRDRRPVIDAIDQLPLGTIVIHGDAAGADTIAGDYARACGLPVIAMPAQWNRDGYAAGPVRNGRMLDVLLSLRACGYDVEVYAFLVEDVANRGTLHMVEHARKRSAPVHVQTVRQRPGWNRRAQ